MSGRRYRLELELEVFAGQTLELEAPADAYRPVVALLGRARRVTSARLLEVPRPLEVLDVAASLEPDPEPDVSYLEPGARGAELPPEDAAMDAARLADYHAGGWRMVTLAVTADVRYSDGETRRETTGLGNIESDSGPDYLAETARELLAELLAGLEADGLELTAARRELLAAGLEVTS